MKQSATVLTSHPHEPELMTRPSADLADRLTSKHNQIELKHHADYSVSGSGNRGHQSTKGAPRCGPFSSRGDRFQRNRSQRLPHPSSDARIERTPAPGRRLPLKPMPYLE